MISFGSDSNTKTALIVYGAGILDRGCEGNIRIEHANVDDTQLTGDGYTIGFNYDSVSITGKKQIESTLKISKKIVIKHGDEPEFCLLNRHGIYAKTQSMNRVENDVASIAEIESLNVNHIVVIQGRLFYVYGLFDVIKGKTRALKEALPYTLQTHYPGTIAYYFGPTNTNGRIIFKKGAR